MASSSSRRPSRPLPNRLLGDFGGTTVRLALQRPGRAAVGIRLYQTAQFASAAAVLDRYFEDLSLTPRDHPRAAAFAFAGPVVGGRVRMTNLPWVVSFAGLKRRFGLTHLLGMNDFAAVAESLPYLKPRDRHKIGPGKPAPGMPLVALGPGTGLGVAALIPIAGQAGRWQAVATEGGHATLSPVDETEDELLSELRRRFGHVSAERAISGQGLENLYAALSTLRGDPRQAEAVEVTRQAAAGDAIARDAIRHFCGMLGTVAGNIALTYGARGGVYLAGGIIGKLGPLFDDGLFRERFAAKGRYRDYLAAVPTYLITHKLPAFIGLAAALDRAAANKARR